MFASGPNSVVPEQAVICNKTKYRVPHKYPVMGAKKHFLAAWSSGQDSGEPFKEFGFEPGLRTFRTLIATIFIGELRRGRASRPNRSGSVVRSNVSIP
jgi:hypothetical protein